VDRKQTDMHHLTVCFHGAFDTSYLTYVSGTTLFCVTVRNGTAYRQLYWRWRNHEYGIHLGLVKN